MANTLLPLENFKWENGYNDEFQNYGTIYTHGLNKPIVNNIIGIGKILKKNFMTYTIAVYYLSSSAPAHQNKTTYPVSPVN
ncbi:hypothetical protein Glove_326g10 [Diversispora epigaea]|uniref:Uncharacterized protein n=1 Tax=Diversispora epigaea TaxID=1348612 RepID=A0A397HQE3_9GLOM|nr:hypothetical protein Glove_326g10 [Diversispora epigaea]